MESARRIKALLPIAAPNALFTCYLIIRNSTRLCLSDFAVETTIANSKILNGKLAIASRKRTMCFRMPLTGQFYIAQTGHSFNDYVCDQIGIVHDRYILHSGSIEEMLGRFKSPSPLGIVYDNEEIVESSARLNFKQTQSKLYSSFQHQDEDGLDPDSDEEAWCGSTWDITLKNFTSIALSLNRDKET